MKSEKSESKDCDVVVVVVAIIAVAFTGSITHLLLLLPITSHPSYIVDNFLDEMDRLTEGGTHKEINSYYFMGVLILEVLLDIVQRDGLLAVFSLFFVFVWLRINTGSWFLSSIGLLVSDNQTYWAGRSKKRKKPCSLRILYSDFPPLFLFQGNLRFHPSSMVLLFGGVPDRVLCFLERSQYLHRGSYGRTIYSFSWMLTSRASIVIPNISLRWKRACLGSTGAQARPWRSHQPLRVQHFCAPSSHLSCQSSRLVSSLPLSFSSTTFWS